jgi:hypothetical protein
MLSLNDMTISLQDHSLHAPHLRDVITGSNIDWNLVGAGVRKFPRNF